MLMGVLCRFLLSELVIRRLFCPPTYYGFGRYLIFVILFYFYVFCGQKILHPKVCESATKLPPVSVANSLHLRCRWQISCMGWPFTFSIMMTSLVGMTVRWYDDIIGGRCEDDCSSQRARRYLNLGWESLPRKTSNGLPYLRQRLAYTILVSSKPSSASLSSCPNVGCHSGSWNWGQLG